MANDLKKKLADADNAEASREMKAAVPTALVMFAVGAGLKWVAAGTFGLFISNKGIIILAVVAGGLTWAITMAMLTPMPGGGTPKGRR